MAQARTLALSGGLYPWLSIVDNVQLQAVLFGRKSAKTTEKAKMLLEKVGMAAHWHEPFSALDAISRHQLQDLAFELLEDKSVLLVTHDPQEALRLSHRIFVLRSPETHQTALSELILPEGNAPRELHQANLWALQQQLLRELGGEQ